MPRSTSLGTVEGAVVTPSRNLAGTSRPFASAIFLESTSLPVRVIESSVSTSGANPMFWTANNPHGFFFAFGGFRAGETGDGFPNSTTALLPGMTTLGCGPPTLTVNEQLDLFPATSVAEQVTVVTPSGKLDPDAGEQVVVTTAELSLTFGAG